MKDTDIKLPRMPRSSIFIGVIAAVVWAFILPRAIPAQSYGLLLVVISAGMIIVGIATRFFVVRGSADQQPGIAGLHPSVVTGVLRTVQDVLPVGRSWVLAGSMEILAIAAIVENGLHEVACFGVAFCLGSLVGIPMQVAARQLAPAVKALRATGREEGVPVIIRAWLLSTALLSGYVLLLVWVLSDDLYGVLSPTYASGAEVALIVGVAYLLAAHVRVLACATPATTEEPRSLLPRAVIIAYAGLAVGMVWTFGMSGGAYATIIALVCRSALPALRSLRSFGISLLEWRLLAVWAMVGALGFVIPWIPLAGNALADTLLRGTLSTVVFWSLAYALGFLGGRDLSGHS